MTDSIINLINHTKPEAFIALVLTFGVGLVVAIIAIVGVLFTITASAKPKSILNMK